MNNCKGIWGKIFGHRYRTVFEEDSQGLDEKITPELITQQLQQLGEDSRLLATDVSDISRCLIRSGRKAKERFKGIFCVRCGDTKQLGNTEDKQK